MRVKAAVAAADEGSITSLAGENVELDRTYIERTDFAVARRGYDPDEVDRHLREIAQAVDDLRREQQRRTSSTPIAGAAVEQVQAIVEAAERSAAEIVAGAEREARQLTDAAAVGATELREQASQEAAARIEAVQDATTKMLQRADRLETEVDRILETLRSAAGFMVENLRGATGSLVEDLRGGSSTLRRELETMREGLADVREPRPRGAVRPERPARVEQDLPASSRVEPIAEQPPETRALGGTNGDSDLAVEDARELEEAHRASAPRGPSGGEDENARVIALNMALDGKPREETARYLSENFDLADQDALLDDVYSRAGS